MSKQEGRLKRAAGAAAMLGAVAASVYAGWQLFKRAQTQQQNKNLPTNQNIVILGGGFAGSNAADALAALLPAPGDANITLVDQDNYMLFTPMLTEVAGGQVDTHHIVRPLRDLPERVTFAQGRVEEIDLANRRITLTKDTEAKGLPSAAQTLPFDQLILALGSVPHFYDIPGLEAHSLTIKTLEEAAAIREKVLLVLERAQAETDPELRRALLTIVVGGGGYTGVETMAAINDLVRDRLPDYPGIRQEEIRVLLIEQGDRLMPEIHGDTLATYAQKKLEERGVEVRLNTAIAEAGEDFIQIKDGERIPTQTLIWAGGVTPSLILDKLDLKRGKHKGVIVDACCRVPDHAGLWAVGDCAEIPTPDGKSTYGPTAQNAQREGARVAQNVVAALRGEEPKPFEYTPIGELAIVGKRSGVAQVYGLNISGLTAWAMWRAIYLAKMPGTGQKIRILMDWLLDIIFGRDIPELSTMRAGA